MRQYYARGALVSNNDLVGNGLIPLELYDQRPETVYTAPNESKYALLQFALSGESDVTETMHSTSHLYRRIDSGTDTTATYTTTLKILVPTTWLAISGESIRVCLFANSQ